MKSKKIAASILAFSLITSAAASNTSVINKIIPINSISASAANNTIYTSKDGKWRYLKLSNNTIEANKYLGTDTSVIIPESIDGFAVKGLSDSMFAYNNNVTSVSIPRGVTEIKKQTFINATSLTQVFLPHGITKIGDNAFKNTYKLKSISFPSSLNELGYGAFEYSGLTSITFTPNLSKIGGYAFAHTAITSLTIPATVKNIEVGAFSNCDEISTVTFSGTCNMEERVFNSCDKLYNINMNITTFANAAKTGALGYCPSLKKINNVVVFRKYANGEPYFASPYGNYLTENFAINDINRVSFMDEYIDAKIKYVARTVTEGCTTDAQKIRKLHDWVCNKVDYAFKADGYTPEDSDEVHCDSSVFFRNTTVCDGYARALTLLLSEAGIEAYNLSNPSEHAWTMVKLGNRYFHIDACHDDGNPIGYDHYLRSDAEIKKCSAGHNFWKIEVLNSRYKYAKPSKLPNCDYSVGDINKDGKVDAKDSSALTSIVTGNFTNYEKLLADANGDGVIDISDASFLRKLYSK